MLALLDDEVAELRTAAESRGEPPSETEPDSQLVEEVGDVLFTAVGVARRLNVDPELALRRTTHRFVERVETAQALAAENGEDWRTLDLDAQDRWYERAKESLR